MGGIAHIILNDDMWFFQCHYKNYPVMPLTLLIESMTQVFCATFLTRAEKKEIPLLVSIGDIRIKESAFPGDK